MRQKFLIAVGVILLLGALMSVAFVLSYAWTTTAIEQEWQTTRVEKISNLGTTHLLEILPLFEEASVKNTLVPEHGVSYLVRTDQQNILLDVGMTPQRLRHNMQVLGITEKDFDAVVITHLHPDHLGGTEAWWNNTLAPGDPPLNLAGKEVYVPLPVSNTDLNTTVVTAPQKLAEGIATIGTIPFHELFPLSLKLARNTEQVLAVNVQGKGVVLITGCGHPSVERIIARAQAIFDQPIVGLVGGLHYEGMTPEQVKPHLAFVSALHPQLIALSPHDSSPAAIQEFRNTFRYAYQELEVGRTITFPLLSVPVGALPSGIVAKSE